MNTLHGRVFIVIAVLVLAMGALAFFVQARTFEFYSLAMTQVLNEQLAKHIVMEYFRGLPPNGDAISTAQAEFGRLMAVNPSIELYLLDANGEILSFTAPRNEVLRKKVDLQPIKEFVAQNFAFPIVDDDPRDLHRMKIFSAARLDPAQPGAGYLYVILGGAEYDAAAHRLQSDLFFRGAFTIISSGVAIALAGAFLVLTTLTKRLRLLGDAMDTFKNSAFRIPANVPVNATSSGDELDRLGRAYNAMVEHIQSQMEEIFDSNTLRRDLIAGLSHDLRTPLALLRGYLETLIMKDDTLPVEEKRRYLVIASRQSDRMNKLVDELFELAKLDELEVRIELEPFQLSELVQDVLQKFRLSAGEQKIDLLGSFTPEAPLALGDIPLIERMLDNLLENAIRHTPAGGQVAVSVTIDDRNLKLEVSDTGSGIPEEDVPHVLERFYRVDKSRYPASGGAGLGLAIAKRIVDLHEGRISISSEVGIGTNVIVHLPMRTQL